MYKVIENIKNWMAENGVSKVELANKLGISEALVRAILNGERRLTAKRIEDFSNVTGIPVSVLIGAPENEFAGYIVMLRGGSKKLNANQESIIMDVALLANEYERLKAFIR